MLTIFILSCRVIFYTNYHLLSQNKYEKNILNEYNNQTVFVILLIFHLVYITQYYILMLFDFY